MVEEELVAAFDRIGKEIYLHNFKYALDESEKVISLIKQRAFDGKRYKYSNENLIWGLLFKQLSDYSSIEMLGKDIETSFSEDLVMNAWIKICEYIERFQLVEDHVKSKNIDNLNHRVAFYKDKFLEHFGDGYYSSPEILCDYFICNICRKDYRDCGHSEMQMYNGVFCRYLPINPVVTAISVVEIPKDYRCRLWPWNVTGERRISAVVMNFSNVEDFLFKD